MSLIYLPEEILLIIIEYLDLKALYHLYRTCVRLRYIVCMYNAVKTCDMRLSTMATARTFKLQFIKDISGHLQELNVSGVWDLNKTSLLLAVKKMKGLKTLDISYTNITLNDLVEVYKVCPTIKNISCNFVYNKGVVSYIPQKDLLETQNLFENFDNINLIGNAANLMFSNLALWILQKAKVNNLNFTIAENDSPVYEVNEEIEDDCLIGDFKFLGIYCLNDWRMNNPQLGSLQIPTVLSKLPSEKRYEFIAITMVDCITHSVYVSPMFKNFFDEYFGIDSKCVNDIAMDNDGNAVLMLWKNSDTVFDETFYINLKSKLINFFPYYKKMNGVTCMGHTDNFFFKVYPKLIQKSYTSTYVPEFKKKRQGVPYQILNYDDALDKKETICLTLLFFDCVTCPILFSQSSQYLAKLTFLSLNGTVHYGADFFNVLFKTCVNLKTLNMEAPRSTSCVPFLARSIPLSRSIQNFRILDKRIDFKILVPSLSQCTSLENIHIVDMSRENNDLDDLSPLVEKCDNLYFIFIHASMSPTAKAKKYQLFKKLKEKYNRPYLYVQLSLMYGESKYRYDPYIDVFRLNPIRPYELLHF